MLGVVVIEGVTDGVWVTEGVTDGVWVTEDVTEGVAGGGAPVDLDIVIDGVIDEVIDGVNEGVTEGVTSIISEIDGVTDGVIDGVCVTEGVIDGVIVTDEVIEGVTAGGLGTGYDIGDVFGIVRDWGGVCGGVAPGRDVLGVIDGVVLLDGVTDGLTAGVLRVNLSILLAPPGE